VALRPAASTFGTTFAAIKDCVTILGKASRLDRYRGQVERSIPMLSWAITFLVIALIAGVLGFGGIAGTASSIAQILFFLFLVLFVVSLIFGRTRTPIA
jgi:uncharacterized membrane protein YtjA (UPF0391 family)